MGFFLIEIMTDIFSFYLVPVDIKKIIYMYINTDRFWPHPAVGTPTMGVMELTILVEGFIRLC